MPPLGHKCCDFPPVPVIYGNFRIILDWLLPFDASDQVLKPRPIYTRDLCHSLPERNGWCMRASRHPSARERHCMDRSVRTQV